MLEEFVADPFCLYLYKICLNQKSVMIYLVSYKAKLCTLNTIIMNTPMQLRLTPFETPSYVVKLGFVGNIRFCV